MTATPNDSSDQIEQPEEATATAAAAPEDQTPAEATAPTTEAPAGDDTERGESAPADAPAPDAETAPEPSGDNGSDGGTAEGEGAEAGQAEQDEGKSDGKGDAKADDKKADDKPKKKKKKKPSGPDPQAIIRQIGTTSEAALVYVANPDPKLSRMARKHREAIISEIPPVTAGALLGPDALCRHFLASAASGRYKDLFFLWDLFKAFPDDCKPVLAQRQRAQEKARKKLQSATHLGLLGSADRVADDIDRAAGLPWRWLKEILDPMGPAIRQRPAVLAAMLRRDPDFDAAIPDEPSDRWLAEAAALRESDHEVPEAIDALLGRYADRLPATLSTLTMAQTEYPDRVSALIDRVDLNAPDIGAILAWARDHGHHDQLVRRIGADVEQAAAAGRAEGLARWQAWQDRGVEVDLPESVAQPTLDGLDLGRPESAHLIKRLIDSGAEMDAQRILDAVAAENRMLGEKAYEAFVCAGFDDVHLPLALEGNPMVRAETRCPACQAWTWVRPGLEKRCPRDECPLRAPADSAKASEDAGATVDAAVASLTGEGGAAAAPAQSPDLASPRPSDRPDQTPPPRPAASAPPAAPAPPEQPAQPEPPAQPAEGGQPAQPEEQRPPAQAQQPAAPSQPSPQQAQQAAPDAGAASEPEPEPEPPAEADEAADQPTATSDQS